MGSGWASSSGRSYWQVLPRGRAPPRQPLGPSASLTSTHLPRGPRCTSGREVCPGLRSQLASRCPSHTGTCSGVCAAPFLPEGRCCPAVGTGNETQCCCSPNWQVLGAEAHARWTSDLGRLQITWRDFKNTEDGAPSRVSIQWAWGMCPPPNLPF